jgi:hypothetical protein
VPSLAEGSAARVERGATSAAHGVQVIAGWTTWAQFRR